eukprot:6459867-Amphidinium_carterae.1
MSIEEGAKDTLTDRAYSTSNFVDMQSKLLRLIMVVVAPDYNGRVSTITVDFDVKARVEASFDILHFRAMQEESDQETKYYLCQMIVDDASQASERLVSHLNTLMTEDRWATDASLEMKVRDFVQDVGLLERDIEWQQSIRLSAM